MMTDSRSFTQRHTGALVAGLALLIMAVIAGVSNFAVIEKMSVPGDPAATAANLADAAMLFRLAATGLVVVAILDVIVAWGLHILLQSVNPMISLLAAWFRVAYAVIFAVAINNIFSAVRAAPIDPAQASFFLKTFEIEWQTGLILFGIHLSLVGFLLWRSDFIMWIFAFLITVAAVGYIVDGLGTLLYPNYSLAISTYTFIGEVIFIFWLLIRGSRLPSPARAEGK